MKKIKYLTMDQFLNHDYFKSENNLNRLAKEYIESKIKRDGYYSYNGYPSVTTVLGMMDPNKDFILAKWRKKLIQQGFDPDEVTENYAKVGTACHYAILSRLTIDEIEPPNWKLEEYPLHCEEYVNNALMMWNILTAGNPPVLDISDAKCEQYHKHDVEGEQFAGIYDLYALCNGKRTLFDLKTSPRARDSYFLQLGAYSMFFPVMPEKAGIINICPDNRNPTLQPHVSMLNQEELINCRNGWLHMIRAWHILFDDKLPIVEKPVV